MPGYSDIARKTPGGATSPSANSRRPTSVGANSSRGGGMTPMSRSNGRGPIYHASSTTPNMSNQNNNNSNNNNKHVRSPSSRNYRGNMTTGGMMSASNNSGMRRGSGYRGSNSNNNVVSSRSDSVSASLFQSKLAEMSDVRSQIEVLARKHKDNEQSLSELVTSILNIDDSHREKTKNELLGIVQERDNTIQMLEVFRQEGNAIIRRLHDNLKAQVGQNERTLRELHGAQRELAAYRASGIDPEAGLSGVRDSSAASQHHQQHGEAPLPEVDELRRRCAEYSGLLREGDNIAAALKLRVEQLAKQLTDAGIVPNPPDSAQMRRMHHGASDNNNNNNNTNDSVNNYQNGGGANINNNNNSGKGDDDDDLALGDAGATPTAGLDEDDLRERLRMERRARLETEEKSHQVYIQQQKQIRLLEQRIAGMQSRADKQKDAGALTPRGGRRMQVDQVLTPSSAAVPALAATPPRHQQQHAQQQQQQQQQQQHHVVQQQRRQPASSPPSGIAHAVNNNINKAGNSNANNDGSGDLAGMVNNLGASARLSSSQRSMRSTDSPTGNPEEDTQMLEDIEKQLQHVYESLENS